MLSHEQVQADERPEHDSLKQNGIHTRLTLSGRGEGITPSGEQNRLVRRL